MYSLTQLSTVAAVLIGATAGAGDLGGFFRNLVVTGRPRWSLFAARVPGGLALLLPMTAARLRTRRRPEPRRPRIGGDALDGPRGRSRPLVRALRHRHVP